MRKDWIVLVECKNCGKSIDTNKKGFGFKHGFLFCSSACLKSFEEKNNIESAKDCGFCG